MCIDASPTIFLSLLGSPNLDSLAGHWSLRLFLQGFGSCWGRWVHWSAPGDTVASTQQIF